MVHLSVFRSRTVQNHNDRVLKHQEYERPLNMSAINYPKDIKDISKSEHQNNINVNSMGVKTRKSSSYIFPKLSLQDKMWIYYISLFVKSHYILVEGLSRLVSRQYNNHNNKKHFCQYCLHGCTNTEILKNYLERFKLHGTQRKKLPEVDGKKGHDKVKFTKTKFQLRLSFVIYADLESVLCK